MFRKLLGYGIRGTLLIGFLYMSILSMGLLTFIFLSVLIIIVASLLCLASWLIEG